MFTVLTVPPQTLDDDPIPCEGNCSLHHRHCRAFYTDTATTTPTAIIIMSSSSSAQGNI
jgi:hypothetical protein